MTVETDFVSVFPQWKHWWKQKSYSYVAREKSGVSTVSTIFAFSIREKTFADDEHVFFFKNTYMVFGWKQWKHRYKPVETQIQVLYPPCFHRWKHR